MKAAHESQSTGPRRGAEKAAGRNRSSISILLALVAGGALRLWMLRHFFEVNGDSLIYGGLAKNLLVHGRFALTVGSGEMYPTLIRLPGYPLFLAVCFRLFGMENYASAARVQIAMELGGCLLLADFARRIAPGEWKEGAAHCTLWLAAICPFTAVYAANPLTEGPTLFVLALAMWAAVRFQERPGWGAALAFTFAVTYAALLRPDGALAAVALAPAMVMGLRYSSGAKAPVFSGGSTEVRAKALTYQSRPDTTPFFLRSSSRAGKAPNVARMAGVCILLALAPFAAWTWRNWHVFHVFEPLAPRYATDPGEDVHAGWESWVKTWSLDFVSTYYVYWSVPDGPLEVEQLPGRAFDSQAQYAETVALAEDYKTNNFNLTPEIDARFGRLAEERTAADPLRSHVWLPLGRVADMWLRPRVENLPIDLDWWVYSHHRVETRFSWAYAGLNAFYLLLGLAGLCLRPRMWVWMLAYMVLRSALLLTVEAPETRYTLECFPMLFVLGGVGLGGFLRRLVVLWRGRQRAGYSGSPVAVERNHDR